MVTIYKNIFSKEPHYITIEKAIDRIKNGTSKEPIESIRSVIDKERANNLKCNLPSVCFSGEFGKDRTDNSLIKHSGFIVLDFDDVKDVKTEKLEISQNKYTYACWISPSGNGLKALCRVADGKRHREYFNALKTVYEGLDDSGVNVSRVCYESYDPNIFVNESAEVFKKIIKEVIPEFTTEVVDENDTFRKILIWLASKGDAFAKGERNLFIFKLASACCRFGINESDCVFYCASEFNDNTFSNSELKKTTKSAYRSNSQHFGTAEFSNDILVDVKNKSEIVINPDIYDIDIRPKDVIFGEDVKKEAIDILENGYEKIDGVGIPKLDWHFKLKRGEITLLTGIGNYGKSSFLKWYLAMRILKYGNKFCLFAPEDNPAQEFYHDMVEIYLGKECTPNNKNRPTRSEYEKAYDVISAHIFYIYPKDIAPSPDYIKERFLELIFKEKVDGCIIDPFNQMQNDYNSSGGRTDKYLETFLSDCSRFAQLNNQFFIIVAHPVKLQKDSTGNYPCPDVYDIADGAMWNNKMDNIIVYHRPNHQHEPDSPLCELHTKKIRRQKTVGKKGTVEFEIDRKTRRFIFDNKDHFEDIEPNQSDELPKMNTNDAFGGEYNINDELEF